MNMKPLRFVGSSLDDLRNFPSEVRRFAGFELRALQHEFEPRDWKPMKTIGSGVNEIRIHVLGEWRIIYVAHFNDAIYVFHFKRRAARRAGRILNWRVNDINRSEDKKIHD